MAGDSVRYYGSHVIVHHERHEMRELQKNLAAIGRQLLM